MSESVCRKCGRSPTAMSKFPFGGDCGGSRVRAGVWSTFGVVACGGNWGRYGGRRVVSVPFGGRRPGPSGLSLLFIGGRVLGTVGGSLA